jgi:hypothetical protein
VDSDVGAHLPALLRRMRRSPHLLVAALLAVRLAPSASAQVRVNPTGVNVNAQGATTAFLTYGGLQDQVPVEAFWCGALVSAAPARGNRCAPATIFGRMPIRYERARLAGGSTLTDIMTIPPSVSRRAYQDAERGNTSSFFYVRRFVSASGGADEYVAVTCRLAGGGARVPFALTDVTLAFDVRTPVLFVESGTSVPPLSATIAYNGTGRLRGRWEVVLPGDEAPSEDDLLTEATLPPEARGSQRRYTELGRFNVFLPPTGHVVLPGPEAARIPTTTDGTYLVLLRVEATNDKEGDSDRTAAGSAGGVVHSGAVAGFPMPVLRYVVGAGAGSVDAVGERGLALLLPRADARVSADSVLTVSWLQERNAALYRVDFETEEGAPLFSAVSPAGAVTYQAPPFLFERASGKAIRWRVVALGFGGGEMRRSQWRRLRRTDGAGS